MTAPFDNDRPVSIRELGLKLDVIRAEQKTEHIWTRGYAVLAAIVGPAVVTKALALLGYISF